MDRENNSKAHDQVGRDFSGLSVCERERERRGGGGTRGNVRDERRGSFGEAKPSETQNKQNWLHFSICACHLCAWAMLIFTASFQLHRETRVFRKAKPSPTKKNEKNRLHFSIWCVSSLRRGHANLLCIIPHFIEWHPRRGPMELRTAPARQMPSCFYNYSEPFGFQLRLTRPVNSCISDVKRITVPPPLGAFHVAPL